MYYTVVVLSLLKLSTCVDIDVTKCGADPDTEVAVGEVELSQYPWVGVLIYKYFGTMGDARAVISVVLIHAEFVVCAAAELGPLPKTHFRYGSGLQPDKVNMNKNDFDRKKSRVLLGEGWLGRGRRVRNYVIHPEYGETYNTLALVQLRDVIRNPKIIPVCPPPDLLRNPQLYVIKMKEDTTVLEKEVIQVTHIPGKLCRDFYIAANLYTRMMRPPYVACAVSLQTTDMCVWKSGAALVSRDVWGRWQLLGIGTRGPGCGAPARYIDAMSYYPWIKNALSQFKRITITRINKQKYVLRAGGDAQSKQRFGNCDDEEMELLAFRERIVLKTDNQQYQFLTYNLTIQENIEYTCLTLELVNASAVSEMRIKHMCPRDNYGPPCYRYDRSTLDISIYLMFSETCLFEMYAYGRQKNMSTLDIQEWKWEEGTYYEDFTMQRIEYRGQAFMTDFGYEPIDISTWVPEYDVWTTTEYDNSTTTVDEPFFRSTTPYVSTTEDYRTRPTRSRSHGSQPKTRTRRTRPTTSKSSGWWWLWGLWGRRRRNVVLSDFINSDRHGI